MSTPVMMEPIAEMSPRFKARVAGGFYLVSILAGGVIFFVHGKLGVAVVAACYLAVTALVYDSLSPVSKGLLLLAASRSLLGQIAGNLRMGHKGVRRTV
jgi:hypothetical protein